MSRYVIALLCLFELSCAHIGPNSGPLVNASIEIEDLSQVIQQCRASLRYITVHVIFEGDFYNHETGRHQKVIIEDFGGNGFSVDPYGSIMTNSHVVDPEIMIRKAFINTQPIVYRKKTTSGYRFSKLDDVYLVYRVFDDKGNLYSTRYKVRVNFLYGVTQHVPWNISVKGLEIENAGQNGKISIKAIDDVADLALITIPPNDFSYLSFDSLEALPEGVDLYSLTFNGASFGSTTADPYVTVRVGPLETKCEQLVYYEGPDTLAAYIDMFANYGNSGGPIVAASGRVAGVIQAKTTWGKGTWAVPADYAYQFYLFATGNSSTKPIEICHCDDDA